MTGAISHFGANAQAIWMFGGAVLGVLLVAALLCMGVAMVRRFLDV